ncbi:MAG: FG-GAP-like repeat-containing protein, partial [Polyangiaceae bacterium]|nr:FG-GAP-like repeat-containing protein [Polyangiaceae bacterium]
MSLSTVRARSAAAYVAILAGLLSSSLPNRDAWAANEAAHDTQHAEAQVDEDRAAQAPAQQAAEEDAREHGIEPVEPAVEPQAQSKLKALAAATPSKPPHAELTTRSLPLGGEKSGVGPTAIAVPKGPGTIEGMGESFSAQASTGVASFHVPFALPKARGGAQPSLGLSYSSGGGNGPVGLGWSVGVPFISRQLDRGLPGYDDQGTWHEGQDRFVFNGGQELVPVLPWGSEETLPSWAGAGWQYFRPRVEGSYLRFFWNPGQQLWRVQDKSGVVLELGAVDGQTDALEADPAHSDRVVRWNLKRQVDAHGNEVRYEYWHDGNQAYLRDIWDTSGASGQWAHHTRLIYEARPDVLRAYNRGWETVTAYRLSRVDVTAVQHEARALLRRYHLSYDAQLHTSMLTAVQVEGRCPSPIVEDASHGLPTSSCTRLPRMEFGYSRVGSAVVDGFEWFDASLHTIDRDTAHPVESVHADLMDINSDGLPDVVSMMPSSHGGRHPVWYLGHGGRTDRFAPRAMMGLQGDPGLTGLMINRNNPDVAVLDVDGDASINLVHMPSQDRYAVFSPVGSGQAFDWVGRTVTTTGIVDSRINFSQDEADIRVFDVNGDGLVDVAKSGASSYLVWFALGRFPGGADRFGQASWSSATTAELQPEPVLRCMPHFVGKPVRFSNKNTHVADMNGDGLTDLVRIVSGQAMYWPGRGNGTFGTGALDCTGGTASHYSFVPMSNPPTFNQNALWRLHVADVNGDGTADLVRVYSGMVEVSLNIDGHRWGQTRSLVGAPYGSGTSVFPRVADMNGSGTADIVWPSDITYRYMDLLGGKRPGLLTVIRNGLGKSTEIEYTTSPAEMLAAERQGAPWTKKAPVVVHMVKRVVVKDGLEAVGRAPGRIVTEYTYRDPVYDGLQREFRGFETTRVRSLGDDNSPSSEVESRFLLGERPSKGIYTDGFDLTKPENAWRDNPYEALKGLPRVSETYAITDQGVPTTYLSTSGTTYTLRKLYDGLDGRGVYVAFAKQTDTWLYDTSPSLPAVSGLRGVLGAPRLPATSMDIDFGESPPIVKQHAEEVRVFRPSGPGDADFPARVLVRSRNGTKHVASDVTSDVWGNRLTETAYGVLGEDAVITNITEPARVSATDAFGHGNWAWRTQSVCVVAGVPEEAKCATAASPRKWSRTTYNAKGDPQMAEVFLDKVEPLYREVAESLPSGLAAPGWIVTSETRYDGFGNAIFTWGAGNRCARVEYDADYHQLPTKEFVYVGAAGTQVAGNESFVCGEDELSAEAQYDRALQAVVWVKDVNDAVSTVRYDGFGRMTAMWAPSSTTP